MKGKVLFFVCSCTRCQRVWLRVPNPQRSLDKEACYCGSTNRAYKPITARDFDDFGRDDFENLRALANVALGKER